MRMPENQAIGLLLIFGVLAFIFGFIMLFDSKGPEVGLQSLLIGAGSILICLLRIYQINKKN